MAISLRKWAFNYDGCILGGRNFPMLRAMQKRSFTSFVKYSVFYRCLSAGDTSFFFVSLTTRYTITSHQSKYSQSWDALILDVFVEMVVPLAAATFELLATP